MWYLRGIGAQRTDQHMCILIFQIYFIQCKSELKWMFSVYLTGRVCVCAFGAYALHIHKMTNESNENPHVSSTVFNIYISFECGMATAWAVSSILYIFEIHPPYYYKYIIRYILYATWSTGFRKMLRSNSKTPRVHFILPLLLLLLQLVTTMMATASGLNPTTVLHQSCIIYTRPWTRWHTHTHKHWSELAEPNESCTCT